MTREVSHVTRIVPEKSEKFAQLFNVFRDVVLR